MMKNKYVILPLPLSTEKREGKTMVNFLLPNNLNCFLEKIAAKQIRTKGNLIEYVLTQYIKENEPEYFSTRSDAMGLLPSEYLPKENKMTWFECYSQIWFALIYFSTEWKQMTEKNRSSFIFGSGCTVRGDIVDQALAYITTMPEDPSKDEAKDLAINIIFGKCECFFHNRDLMSNFKLAAYAYRINEILG